MVKQSICSIILFLIFLCIANGSYAAVELEYKYDALGRLVTVEDPVNTDRNYDYDAAGNRKSVYDGTTPGGGGETPPSNNSAPVANNDGVYLSGLYVARRVNVISNDTDADGDTLSIHSFVTPSGLALIKSGSTSFYVEAVGGSATTRSFSYEVSDGRGGLDTGIVTVFVNIESGGIPYGTSPMLQNAETGDTTKQKLNIQSPKLDSSNYGGEK